MNIPPKRRCILIFNGPQSEGENKIFLRAKKFFDRIGFTTTTITLTDNSEDLQDVVCEEVRTYRNVFWVCCVVAPGAQNIFLLNERRGETTKEQVSFALLQKWFIENRGGPLSRVVLIFDINSKLSPQGPAAPSKLVSTDGNILRFVSYSQWADGKSPCMEQLCRDGTPSSMKEWLETTKELMISAYKTSNNLTQVPEISATCIDSFDINGKVKDH
ncbi:hypothetical protein CAPTEDRAFT_223376 [Capitella teleta]|uniref:Caspase family p20 domain-containing protein n=1 Tax=Capitella teleta TaxID=283909 RepID=R7V9U4_CAPTE|nr:hypothetical protein CAPTEDRAFT_223376 [Capitella teleta]|eukprot:ELU15364.1 hypothetical protein CAPTEDRAFT_223376 [Capitella teleta]